jgi:hypothetical protein
VARFPYTNNYRPPQPLHNRVVYAMGLPMPANSHAWGYSEGDGPSTWASTGFPLCAGRSQSPVDIVTQLVDRSQERTRTLEFEWKPQSGLSIFDTLHGLQVGVYLPLRRSAARGATGTLHGRWMGCGCVRSAG